MLDVLGRGGAAWQRELEQVAFQREAERLATGLNRRPTTPLPPFTDRDS